MKNSELSVGTGFSFIDNILIMTEIDSLTGNLSSHRERVLLLADKNKGNSHNLKLVAILCVTGIYFTLVSQ